MIDITPKEYLSQAIMLDEKIEANLEVIIELKAKVFGSGLKISNDVKVQTSNVSDPSNLIDKIIDLENELNFEVDSYINLKKKLTKEINKLENNIYSLLLIKRYILNKSLYDISKEMCYSYHRIRHLHGEALEAFKLKYPDKF